MSFSSHKYRILSPQLREQDSSDIKIEVSKKFVLKEICAHSLTFLGCYHIYN